MTAERREQIIRAARALVDEQDPNGLSVRTVAARAGVGASTLRHYFPTQNDLRSAVLATYLDDSIGELRIRDSAIPARDRLIECLLQFIRVDVTEESWRLIIGSFLGPGAAPGADQVWAFLADRVSLRVISWLRVLAAEGATRTSDAERHARLLVAVVDGVAVGRIAGPGRPTTAQEHQLLGDAVDAVLA